MELDNDCLKSLCSMGIAAGTFALGLGGISVAAGATEFLTASGDLALSVSDGQKSKLAKLHSGMAKSITKSYKTWLEKAGANEHLEANVAAALAGLNDAMLQAAPTVQDMVAAKLDADKLVAALQSRLPIDSPYRPGSRDAGENELGPKILTEMLRGVFDLARSDKDLHPQFSTLSFEGLFADNAITHANQEHIIALLENRLGIAIDPEKLRPLFEHVGHSFPEQDHERAILSAVEALRERAEDPVPLLNDPVEIQSAIQIARQKLGELDTAGALAHLRKVRAASKNIRTERQRGEARLALEEAQILENTFQMDDALAAYAIAAELDPDDPWPWFHRGDIRKSRGNLAAALEDYLAGQRVAQQIDDERELSVSYTKIGDLDSASGNSDAARTAFQNALDIAKKLAEKDPSNTQWQSDLSVSYSKIGELNATCGNLDTALIFFLNALDILITLERKDPKNVLLKNGLASMYTKIGELNSLLGNFDIARIAFKYALDVRNILVKIDPSNNKWQRDLFVSYSMIGDLDSACGNVGSARIAIQNALDIIKNLVDRDPSNTEWQRDLSVGYTKVGDSDSAHGKLEAARIAIQNALDISKKLAKKDPTNTEWQRDLSVNYNRIGGIEKACGDLPTAFIAFSKSLSIRNELAKNHPANTEWQRDLIVSYCNVADLGIDSVKNYSIALDIVQKLKAHGRLVPADEWMLEALESRLEAARKT